MLLTADNHINAKLGDDVEINLQTSNFLLATAIAYGIPLLGLIIGIVGGFYGLRAFHIEAEAAQGAAAAIGLVVLALSYLIIKKNESIISSMSHFKPTIVKMCDNEHADKL